MEKEYDKAVREIENERHVICSINFTLRCWELRAGSALVLILVLNATSSEKINKSPRVFREGVDKDCPKFIPLRAHNRVALSGRFLSC